jgi:hypothetical protein
MMRHLLRSAPAALQHVSVALCGANISIHSEQVFRVIRALHLGEVRIGFATKRRADEIVILSVATEIEVHAARAVPLHIGPSFARPPDIGRVVYRCGQMASKLKRQTPT